MYSIIDYYRADLACQKWGLTVWKLSLETGNPQAELKVVAEIIMSLLSSLIKILHIFTPK